MGISIDHQFRRRHSSAPPPSLTFETSWLKPSKNAFEHVAAAEGYAALIGRPEGTIRKRSARPGSRDMNRSTSDLGACGVPLGAPPPQVGAVKLRRLADNAAMLYPNAGGSGTSSRIG